MKNELPMAGGQWSVVRKPEIGIEEKGRMKNEE